MTPPVWSRRNASRYPSLGRLSTLRTPYRFRNENPENPLPRLARSSRRATRPTRLDGGRHSSPDAARLGDSSALPCRQPGCHRTPSSSTWSGRSPRPTGGAPPRGSSGGQPVPGLRRRRDCRAARLRSTKPTMKGKNDDSWDIPSVHPSPPCTPPNTRNAEMADPRIAGHRMARNRCAGRPRADGDDRPHRPLRSRCSARYRITVLGQTGYLRFARPSPDLRRLIAAAPRGRHPRRGRRRPVARHLAGPGAQASSGTPSATCAPNFRRSQTTKALEVLEKVGEHYRPSPTEIACDLWDFQVSARRRGPLGTPTSKASAVLRQAIDVYKGDLLAGSAETRGSNRSAKTSIAAASTPTSAWPTRRPRRLLRTRRRGPRTDHRHGPLRRGARPPAYGAPCLQWPRRRDDGHDASFSAPPRRPRRRCRRRDRPPLPHPPFRSIFDTRPIRLSS